MLKNYSKNYLLYLSLTLCLIVVDYYFLNSLSHLENYSNKDLLRLCLFAINCSLMLWMVRRLKLEQHRAGHLLHREREADLNYRAIVELSPYMIWHADASGEITYVNQTVLEYCQKPTSEVLGSEWLKYVHPEDRDRLVGRWTTALKDLKKFEIEYRICGADQNYRWFFVNAKPVYDVKGVARWIGQAVDVHDRKMAIAAHENAIAARDRFMSLASHELRTPLTSIKLQMQILNRQIQRQDISLLEFDHLKEIADLALKQVDQLNHLIEEMLDVSRISAGKMTFSFCSCDLEDLIKRAISIVAPHYSHAKVFLETEIEPKLLIMCDENKLSQVIINLLTNALKYGGGNPVKLTARRELENAVIEVIDLGIGIPLEAQKKIFEPFERVTHQTSIAGLGLGLYISKEVIQAHKGSIRVVSRQKKGSKFILEIPLMQNQMNFFENQL